MGFGVNVRHSLHESRTKFYQAWSITNDAGKTVAITHWGKATITGSGSGFERLSQGQHKFMESVVATDAQVRIKRGRGYESWLPSHEQVAGDLYTLRMVLRSRYGFDATSTEMVTDQFVLATDSTFSDRGTPTPIAEPEAVAPADRGESWGTW